MPILFLRKLKKIEGTSDVKLSVGNPNPELLVNIDKQKMADNGLTMDIVGATMQIAYSGNKDAKYRDGEFEYDINVKYDEFNRNDEKDVAGLSFVNCTGQLIRLDQFADIRYTSTPSCIERNDRIKCQTLYSQVFGRAMGDVGDDIKKRLGKINFPKEVTLSYEGDLKAQTDSFGSLGIALIASIIFVYLLMVALYQSYLYPFVVLFTIPLAIVGALLALALTGQTLSILTLMGLMVSRECQCKLLIKS